MLNRPTIISDIPAGGRDPRKLLDLSPRELARIDLSDQEIDAVAAERLRRRRARDAENGLIWADPSPAPAPLSTAMPMVAAAGSRVIISGYVPFGKLSNPTADNGSRLYLDKPFQIDGNVTLIVGHDGRIILASTDAGTLRISQFERGLCFDALEIDPALWAQAGMAADVESLGVSPSMMVEDGERAGAIRWIHEARLEHLALIRGDDGQRGAFADAKAFVSFR